MILYTIEAPTREEADYICEKAWAKDEQNCARWLAPDGSLYYPEDSPWGIRWTKEPNWPTEFVGRPRRVFVSKDVSVSYR